MRSGPSLRFRHNRHFIGRSPFERLVRTGEKKQLKRIPRIFTPPPPSHDGKSDFTWWVFFAFVARKESEIMTTLTLKPGVLSTGDTAILYQLSCGVPFRTKKKKTDCIRCVTSSVHLKKSPLETRPPIDRTGPKPRATGCVGGVPVSLSLSHPPPRGISPVQSRRTKRMRPTHHRGSRFAFRSEDRVRGFHTVGPGGGIRVR